MSFMINTAFKNAQRVVVKVGSNVLTGEKGLNMKNLNSISRQICNLIDEGREVILVTSGSMAAGIRKMGINKRPDDLPGRQAIAAVGQAGLIMEYEKAFAKYNRKVAQILLTGQGLDNRERYLNTRNTLHTLISWGVVPIINENDTVSIEEIKFGDNDNLSAMIALLVNADILINLTNIDGLYTDDPRNCTDAKLIPVISAITSDVKKMAGNIPGPLGTGGMQSKIDAAIKAGAAGIPMVIANGGCTDILNLLFSGKSLGTFFIPSGKKLKSRKCWIGFTVKPKGSICIDSGASQAIVENGKSLLPGGIVAVNGDFPPGAPVEILSINDSILCFMTETMTGSNSKTAIGTGLVNYSASDIRKIMGLKSSDVKKELGEKPYDEVIHRNNLVITCHD
ncbi:MAG: glutamate 5-kinase [Desulfobacteraceae bacterium 4572_19]|nr:MAG: glutamate 5-kinase [Desulfobacteraceae bacterium 4572_19]